MRTLILIPLAVALVASVGMTGCAVLGLNPHGREMLVAAVACLMASELALLPITLTRGAEQPAVVQAALVGTMLHLFLCTAVAAAVMLTKSWKLDEALVYWLMAQYCVTLIVLVIGFVRAIKTAPIGTTTAVKH